MRDTMTKGIESILEKETKDFEFEAFIWYSPYNHDKASSLLLRANDWDECETCGEDGYIEIPLSDIRKVIALLEKVKMEVKT
jgi:hypothetical protein